MELSVVAFVKATCQGVSFFSFVRFASASNTNKARTIESCPSSQAVTEKKQYKKNINRIEYYCLRLQIKSKF